MPELCIHGLVEESIVDGPGLRFAIFTQGCPHHCKGCHNPETHARDGGTCVDTQTLFEQFVANPLLAGITLSGGEPFLQAQALVALAKSVKEYGKTVMAYTGYTFEALYRLAEQDAAIYELLACVDTLVDGPYCEELRDLTLLFRGSSNQRLLSHEDRQRLLSASER